MNYNDKKYINKDTIRLYANTNEEHLVMPVKGIVVEFPGLGGGSCLGGLMDMQSYSSKESLLFAQKGIIIAYLFPGPWSWGNKGAVRMADAVIDAIKDKYTLNDKIPVAACGGSMGGLGALIFSAGTRHKLCMVAAACPCIDVLDRLNCDETFPRTFISAAACYDMELENALKSFSPMHCIDKLQNTDYFICSDAEDQIFPESQCDLFVEKLRARNLHVEYHKQPALPHGGFLPEIREKLHCNIESAILKTQSISDSKE